VTKGISPIEAWQLEYPEIYVILDMEKNSIDTDTGMMINYARKRNGVKDKRYLISEH